MTMTTLFNYLLIFNVFAGGFVLFHTSFEFYMGYIFIAAFLAVYIVRYRSFAVNSGFLLILAILTISSVANTFLGNGTTFLVLKQVLGIFITGSAYYLLIKINDGDINTLFRIYLRIAVVVAAIGIFQEYCFLMDFKMGYDYSWLIPKWKCLPAKGGLLRVNSIFLEPTHLVITMAPALFVSLVTLLRNNAEYLTKKAAIVIIICSILTFSPFVYIVIVAGLLMIYANNSRSRYLLIVIIIAVLGFINYLLVPEIRMRVDDTIDVVTGTMPITRSHLTIYAYASNAFVAFKSFVSNPLFGCGLGSHPVSYDKYIYPGAANAFWQKGYTGINKADANCLFLRLLSETGLFGVIIVLYFVFRFRLTRCDDKNMQILSNAVFILLIVQLLRQGHYFYNGLFFFVWLYYFAYKLHNKPG